MKLDYFLYMAEASGCDNWVSTRQTRINAAINDFIKIARAGYNINDSTIQDTVLKNHNIEDLSAKESNYIAETVKKFL